MKEKPLVMHPTDYSICSFRRRRFGPLACLFLFMVGCGLVRAQETSTDRAAAAPDAATEEWFEKHVRPLLVERCYSCHSKSFGNNKGGLTLDSREAILTGGDSGPAVVPGKPDESLMIEAVRRESFEMPPDKELPAHEVEVLVEWVRRGAPWPQRAVPDQSGAEDWIAQRMATHWAWQPVVKPKIPAVDDPWPRNAIDRFIRARQIEQGVAPIGSADFYELVRRVNYDLAGLPPTSQQLAELSGMSATQQEAYYERLVDRLLASPQFGVRWGRHWLDLVRYAETLGHEFDYPIHYAWRYRDAVIDALNSDVPYDRFLQEHIAGDLLPNHRIDPLSGVDQSLAMTGFWFLGDAVHAPVDILNDAATRMENQIDVFSKAMLGLTVACARCHDHKFDAIGMKDYYGLTGVLMSTRRVYALTDPHGRIDQATRRLRERLQQCDAAAWGLYRRLAQTGDPPSRSESVAPRVSHALPSGKRSAVLGQPDIRRSGGSRLVQGGQRLVAYQDRSPANWRQWLDSVVAKIEALPAKELNQHLPENHPLFMLRALVGKRSGPQQWASLARQVVARQAAFEQWLAGTELVEDFEAGLPSDWQIDGPVADVEPTSTKGAGDDELRRLTAEPQIDWFSNSIPLPRRSGVLASQIYGTHQQVIARSPGFEISQPVLCIKMRGTGVHSSLIIDNYFMTEFHSLLFKDIRKDVNQPYDSGWVVHRGDLNKYVGQPAYLSFEDRGDGWFEIDEIRFAPAPPPPQPHPAALAMAGITGASGDEILDEVARQIRRAFVQIGALESGRSDRLSREDSPSVMIVRGVLRAAAQFDVPLPQPRAGDQQAAALSVPPDGMDPEQVRAELETLDRALPAPLPLLAAAEGTPTDAPIALRGDPHQPGEVVARGALASLAVYRPAAADSSGRLELAQALGDPRHPLVARVLVNRVWHHLMGRGIVDSPDNFGVLGGRPTHPELLDFLATEFVEHGWSIKWLIRQIVTSNTYRLASNPTADQRRADPDHRLWSWRPVRRLSSEALRDSLLVIAGQLDARLGGPGVAIYLRPQMSGRGRPRKSGPLDGQGRRTVYIEIRRNFLDPFQLAFDFPMPATCVGRRNVSNVPAQALCLLNDPLVDAMVQRWVERTTDFSSPRERVEQMIVDAFGRPARPEEIERCLPVVEGGQEANWNDLAHVLINAKEFWFVP